MTAPAAGTARAFWVKGPGRGVIRCVPLPPAAPDQVSVRSLFSAISRGTERLVFNGAVPASQYTAMAAPFQAGEFPGPVKYGYSNVGVVTHGPPHLRGRAVFCLYPHQTAYVVPAAAVTPLPLDVPPSRAVLAANMETAINGLWDASPRLGDHLAVIGAGVVGCLMAHLARHLPGAHVQLVDIDPAKGEIADRLGLDFATPDRARGEVDCAIHASGAPAGLATALELLAFEGTVVEMSWFGDRPVPLPLGEAFHARRLTIRSSQVGQVAAPQRPRWDRARRRTLALALLADGRLDALVSGESPFEDLPATLARLAREPGGELCHRIAYPLEADAPASADVQESP